MTDRADGFVGNSAVRESLLRLSTRYSISTAIAATAANAVRLCVLVNGDACENRARFRIGDQRMDIFISTEVQIKADIASGRRTHVTDILASGVCAFGDQSVAGALRKSAQGRVRPADALPNEQFRAECQPFDLLREYHIACTRDAASAILIAHAVIAATIDAFFIRHRLAPGEVTDILARIERHNKTAGAALRSLLELPIDSLIKGPEQMKAMVRNVLGEEPTQVESWWTSPPSKIDESEQSQISRREQHPASAAMRAYAAFTPGDQPGIAKQSNAPENAFEISA